MSDLNNKMIDLGNLYDAMDRKAQRHGDEIFEPVKIRNEHDIKRAIQDLHRNADLGKSSRLTTDLVGLDDKNSKNTYRVTANLEGQSRLSIILNGLDVVKRQLELIERESESVLSVTVNGRNMKPSVMPTSVKRCWVDPLIERWLGGFRDGLLICWDLVGYRYHYNLYEHRLTRVKL